MGDANQISFVQEMRGQLCGPFLEVGSKDYGNTQDLRSLFPREVYVGVDMSAGPGVDQVLDLTRPMHEIDAALEGRRFGTVFCFSVLEHCDQPFQMAQNMTDLLIPGGHLVIGVPFAWQFHGYPNDYWRFTHEGVRKLFPGIHFDLRDGHAFSCRQGDAHPLDAEVGAVRLGWGFYKERGQAARALLATLARRLGEAGVLSWLLAYPYLLAPTMISMVGRRVSPSTGGP